MTAFEAAVDVMFADPSIAEDATLERAGEPDKAVRVVVRRPDEVTDAFGETRIQVATTVIDVRAAEAAPAAGDVFVLADGTRRVVQGEPVRDELRLVRRCDTRPE